MTPSGPPPVVLDHSSRPPDAVRSTGILPATIGYLVGSVGPVLAAAALITVAIEDACADTDYVCWAPLAYLLLIPVALVGMVVFGPIGCVMALRSAGHERPRETGWRCAALAIVLPMVTMTLASVGSALPVEAAESLAGVALFPFGMIVAIPVIARAWTIAGQPASGGAGWDRPRGTTWESAPSGR